jgi:hypothetical protein
MELVAAAAHLDSGLQPKRPGRQNDVGVPRPLDIQLQDHFVVGRLINLDTCNRQLALARKHQCSQLQIPWIKTSGGRTLR